MIKRSYKSSQKRGSLPKTFEKNLKEDLEMILIQKSHVKASSSTLERTNSNYYYCYLFRGKHVELVCRDQTRTSKTKLKYKMIRIDEMCFNDYK